LFEMMDGEIGVDGAAGKGARFWLVMNFPLPAVSEPAKQGC